MQVVWIFSLVVQWCLLKKLIVSKEAIYKMIKNIIRIRWKLFSFILYFIHIS